MTCLGRAVNRNNEIKAIDGTPKTSQQDLGSQQD
jgi:hypothetical protein